MPTQLDRYRGCLLGGAVGDALGAAVEFADIATIRERFGPAGILAPAEAYGRIGAITDDTQMTLFTAEAMLQTDDRAERGIADPPSMIWFAYQRWLRTQGLVDPWRDGERLLLQHGELHRVRELHAVRAPGTTCLSALRGSLDFDGERPYPIAENDSKGCGGVMRAAPCGLVDWEEELVFRVGVMSAALTHGHPSGHLAAGALALIIRRLRDGRPLPQAVDAAVQAVATHPGGKEVGGALREARERAQGPMVDVATFSGGWIAEEALAIAVYCGLTHQDDFAGALRLAANHSGDSDSTAAIAGNILGTGLGARAIPPAWLEALQLRDTIDRLATAMHDRFVLGHREVNWKRWNYVDGPGYEAPDPPHDAYWVSPGRLLAGPYPGAADTAEADAKLSDFLDLGVTCFMDLTEEGEGDLQPYAATLRRLAERRHIDVTHMRMPIRDVDTAPTWRMRAIQDTINRALEAREMVYVHCWGGVGRTGTVIGCHLVQSGTHSGEQALETLKQLRCSTQRSHRVSPETQEQQNMVRHWIAG